MTLSYQPMRTLKGFLLAAAAAISLNSCAPRAPEHPCLVLGSEIVRRDIPGYKAVAYAEGRPSIDGQDPRENRMTFVQGNTAYHLVDHTGETSAWPGQTPKEDRLEVIIQTVRGPGTRKHRIFYSPVIDGQNVPESPEAKIIFDTLNPVYNKLRRDVFGQCR